MEDGEIVELYWQRDEQAIRVTEEKYGHYLGAVAHGILTDTEDCRETVNETYLRAWNSIPPQKPEYLGGYLAKITRQLAIDAYRRNTSKKRGGAEYDLSLDELSECVEGGKTPQKEVELKELSRCIQSYLQTISAEKRNLFVCRYFFMDSLAELSEKSGYSMSKVKSILHRVRKGLLGHLEKEGFL